MSPPRPELAVHLDPSVDDDVDAAWDETRIAELVRSIVGAEFPDGGEYAITVRLVSDTTIRALNAEHRGVDAHTDVLSFALMDADQAEFILPPGEPVHLGDVVVSHPRAVEQAREYGHSVAREVGYLVAHGVLHILGYDHEQEADRTRMRQREEEALAPLGFTR